MLESQYRLKVNQWYFRIFNYKNPKNCTMNIFKVLYRGKEDNQTYYNIINIFDVTMMRNIRINYEEKVFDTGFTKEKDLVKPFSENNLYKYIFTAIFEWYEKYIED